MRQGGVWARPGSGFTLLFEVAMLTYAKQMPIAPLAQLARAHRIWRVIEHHVNTARAGMDFSRSSHQSWTEPQTQSPSRPAPP